MQVIFHCGAHFTDDDRLIKCLLRNKEGFAKRGIAVPGPGRYRDLLRNTLGAMQTSDPDPQAREVLMDAILDEEKADRLILSNASFFGVAKYAVRKGMLYPSAPDRMKHLRTLFPFDQLELFLAIRNPATFLPAVYERVQATDIGTFLGGREPQDVRWSDTIHKIRAAAPDISITVWCNEDTPLIWAQIIRELAGLEHGEKIVGGFDLLQDLMSEEGMKRFRAYLKSHPVMTEMQKRRVIAAFLDKFALEDALEEELDLPGWTEDLVDEMTDIYDEDLFQIQRIPGVQLIAP
jgi:hypothetical protein